MASALEIQNGRKHEAEDVARYLSMTGSMLWTYKTLLDGAGDQVNIQIGTEGGDGATSLKVKAIEKGLNAVIAAGFGLPDLTFYCTQAVGVPCIALMGNRAGNPEYTVFMGPKTGQHNPQASKMAGLKGGVGQSGPRGVADQVYDGTQRWFGNPKMHAHATTVVIHELGHVLHDVQSPSAFWDLKLGRVVNNGYVAIAASVSHYATNNGLEFVAEVFAGTLAGKTYAGASVPYAALGGPTPVVGTFP